jgi:transcriptional regulator with GAF, ATPase, and Fis domain
MRCPLCAGPLHEEAANIFRCEVGHEIAGDDLQNAATSRASVALWMAIEALETEATALRSVYERSGIGETAEMAEQAERDARLLRELSTAHEPPGTVRDDHRRARLNQAVRAVSLFLIAEAPLGKTLERIAKVAREAVGDASAAGITLLDEQERPKTRVWTDELSVAIDQAQYAEDAGPCLEAYRQGQIVRIDDTQAVAERWPAYSRETARHGVRSTLSLPLQAAGDVFGALNLYATVERAFGNIEEADAELLATQVSVVLANARAYWEAFDLAQGLSQALESRAAIEQAKGKIMATNGCGPDEAFAVLVRASQRENTKLRDIARRIVEGPTQISGGGLTPPAG